MPANRRLARALLCSAALHASALLGLAAVVLDAGLRPPTAEMRPKRAATIPVTHIVFLPSHVSGGGGGGGGNRQPGPIRRAEGIGRDRATLRIAKPAPVVPPTAAVDRAPALPALVLDAAPLASGARDIVGLPVGGVPDGLSTGSGSGGGVGTGVGTGIGSGTGPGIGEGRGGGTGGGVYRSGGSVSAPRLLREVRPTYSADALARRVQGAIILEMVVTAAGLPSDIRVVRPLDPELDEKAIDAVREWRFDPGRLSGRAVNVLVTVVLDFTIH